MEINGIIKHIKMEKQKFLDILEKLNLYVLIKFQTLFIKVKLIDLYVKELMIMMIKGMNKIIKESS